MIPIRDENPARTFPFLTLLIILANCGIFIYQLYLGALADGFILARALIPGELTALLTFRASGSIATLLSPVTAIFLHGGIFHLAGNMLFLWIFGKNIEDATGHLKFAAFFLTCGLAAAILHVSLGPHSLLPMLGASGAVSGVMGAYLLLFPRARIVTLVILIIFIRTIRVPAWLFLAVWFLLQLLGSHTELGSPGQGGVAFAAHIGGFLAGMVLIPFFIKNGQRSRGPRYSR